LSDTATNTAPPSDDTPLVGTPIEDRISNPIEGESVEARVRASVDALNEKRQREWESGQGSDDLGTVEEPTIARQKAPLVEVRLQRGYKPAATAYSGLKEVTASVSDAHMLQKPWAQSMMRDGYSAEQVLTLAKDAEFLRRVAPETTPGDREYFARTGDEPARKPTLHTARAGGGVREPLRDDVPILEMPKHNELNLREATREKIAGKEHEAAELSRQELARQEAEYLALQQQLAPVAQAQAQPVAAATEQPQRPDPVEVERAQLAAAQQYYAIAATATEAERHAAGQINAWRDAFNKAYPEANNPNAIEELRRTNVQRFGAMQRDAQRAGQNIDVWMQRGAQATAQRQAVEQHVAQQQNAEVRARWHAYKDQQDALAAKYVPELADATKTAPLRQATREMLRERGFDDRELAHVWDGHGGVSIRDARVQAVIADAARWRMAQANAKNISNNRAPVPPVLRPGTARPRGADNEADIARLERQLESATGNKAVRIATRLTQLRRGS
jgi:hypothetical protein